MVIYKITCTVNNKIYIGQTKNAPEFRFDHHIQAALSNKLNTHLARAIRKYGADAFIQEVIDTADTPEELTAKEYYWINYYRSYDPEIGYNETNNPNRCGGNTYRGKSAEEMKSIKAKISASKIGAKNPRSKAVLCVNVKNGEELIFGSTAECARYFGIVGTTRIRMRCNGEYDGLYRGEWKFTWAVNDHC